MKTVLIVEDDLISYKVFHKILTKRGGLAAKHSANAEEIMQIAQSQEADLILMDASLHNSYYQGKAIDGIEMIKILKEDAQAAKIPVILVTAEGTADDRAFFLNQSGADGYIPKPVIDHQEFLAEIQAKI